MTIKDRRSTPTSKSSGVSGELRRLKANSSATYDELSEFVSQMHGKSPQEVLGLVAQSGLAKGIFLSTVICAVLVVAFTVGPYYWGEAHAGGEDSKTEAAPAAKGAKSTAAAKEETANEKAAPAATGKESTPAESDNPVVEEVKKRSETKGTTPDDVPELDNLLDDIE